jgi:RNA polymerase sigma-70 factor (ECF subfamily)
MIAGSAQTPERPRAGTRTALEDEEAALLEQVAAGDRGQPLVELYRRYEGRLYGLGLRLLHDRGLAEELVQETFVRLWRSAGQYDSGRGSVRTCVFTIARRLAIDLWRRPSSRPFEPDAEERAGGGDAVEQALVGITVRDAMNSLSGDHRRVLELSYDEQLTQVQIADRLGVPLGTVKSRTFHALRALKAALEERGVDG